MTNSIKLFILLLLSFLIVAITINYGQIQQAMNSRQQNTNSLNSDTTTPMYNYRIVNIFPHDDGAYTQGLVYDEGVLYEGTGLRGQSTLRKVDLETGVILQIHQLPGQYFGEGVTVFKDRIIQLTWQSNLGFVYDKERFILMEEIYYGSEGWGLTHDGKRLIMSDGSSTIYFLDPYGFQQVGKLEVTDGGKPVNSLNELEYVNGKIYANVYPTGRIAIISPQSGQVIGWIDLTGLAAQHQQNSQTDVLNGIAYDSANNRLFVTGKLWSQLYEVEIYRQSE